MITERTSAASPPRLRGGNALRRAHRQRRGNTMGAQALLRYLCGLILGLALAGQALAAGLEAVVDRDRIAEGETLTLRLSAPGDTRGSPDLGPLEKEFDVLGQAQSSRVTIVNGRSNSSRDWQLTLVPKHSGRLVVPSISLGGLSSVPIQVEVLKGGQVAEAGAGSPVMVEADLDAKSPYVQGQTVYTVRVLYRVPLVQAGLSEPKAGDAIIERLGEDRSYSTRRGGQRYNVIERRYALFPQHSGSVQIDAPVLSASIPDERATGQGTGGGRFGRDPFGDLQRIFGRDPFAGMDGLFEQTRPIQVRGPALTLDVKPQPPGTPTPWLPAESVQLAESWSPDPPTARVGEPITRTIAITAEGVTAAQIPDLQPPVPDGVKVYPDKTRTETRPEGDGLVAMKVLKQALVPSKAGRLSLPEVRLAWWDTRTGRQAVAALPARTLEVLPAPAGSVAPAPEPAPVPAAAAAPETSKTSADAGSERSGSVGTAPAVREGRAFAGYWPWISAFLGLGWLSTLLLSLSARRTGRFGPSIDPAGDRPRAKGRSPNSIRAQIEAACRRNDGKEARQALLAWGAARWPESPPRRLDALAARLGEPAGRLLRELDRSLYGAEPATWDGRAAWAEMGPSLDPRRSAPKAGSVALPELYP